MDWADELAASVEGPQVVNDSKTPSGTVHVGSLRGPVILELNARPGLAIQIANRAGLMPRLDAIERTWQAGRSVEERVALGRDVARSNPPLA